MHQQNMQMIPNSCYSSLCLILKVVSRPTPLSHWVTTSNYSVSHFDKRLNFDKHISNVCPISYLGLSSWGMFRSQQSRILCDDSHDFQCRSSAHRHGSQYMLNWRLLLQYPPTIEFRIALQALSNPPTLLLCCTRYMPVYPQRVTFKLTVLSILVNSARL